MSRQRRQFSAEFKTKVVLELLEGSETLNQIASKYDLLPKMLLGWKKQFLENAALAREPAKAVKEYKDELAAKDREIDQLQKALGKRTAELDWLSGKLAGSSIK
jgi:putative transposase